MKDQLHSGGRRITMLGEDLLKPTCTRASKLPHRLLPTPIIHITTVYVPKLCTRVLRGSVVKCLIRNPVVLGLSRTGSSEFFVGVSLGKTLQSPSLVLMKPRKDMNDVSCRCDMTEILLKVA